MPLPFRRRRTDGSSPLLLLVMALVWNVLGCQTARNGGEKRDDQFFEPITSLPGTSPALVFSADHRESDSLAVSFIDSLQNRIDQQEQLIEELRDEVRRLQHDPMTSNNAGADSVRRAPPPAITYEQAWGQFTAKNYHGAIRLFRGLIIGGIDAKLADDCQLLVGRSFFYLQQYHQALAEAEKVLRYGDSDKLDAAHFLLGQCHEVLGNSRKARKAYETILQEYPGSGLSNQARQRLSVIE